MAAAAAAPNLDCLIAAHDSFLSRVLERALLGDGKAEGLRRTLGDLLTNCMDLRTGAVRMLKDKVGAETEGCMCHPTGFPLPSLRVPATYPY
jgi:hypothetical protein